MCYPVVTGINCAVVHLCVCAFVQVIAIRHTCFLFGPGCQFGLLRPWSVVPHRNTLCGQPAALCLVPGGSYVRVKHCAYMYVFLLYF